MAKAKPDSQGAVEYVNRKRDTYYLQAGQTKTGKPRYYLGKKVTGTPLDKVPEGYEIYEIPTTALVVLRKSKPTLILPEERLFVEDSARRQSGVRQIIVDVEEQALVVYLPSMSDNVAHELFGFLAPLGRMQDAKDLLFAASVYTPMLRFELENPETRLFTVQRWCFLGSIDDWFFLGGPRSLADHVNKYAKHLGNESFFELM